MTVAQGDRVDDLAAQQVGETDDGLVLAQDDSGAVYIIDESGEAWLAQWVVA